MFTPSQQLVVVSLAIKLNRIPGRGNAAISLSLSPFKMGGKDAYLKTQTYNYCWRHGNHTFLTGQLVFVQFTHTSNFPQSHDLSHVNRNINI